MTVRPTSFDEPPGTTGLAAALERAEGVVAESNATEVVIGGTGNWALGLALACAKASIPFTYEAGSAAAAGSVDHERHLRNLADRVVEAADGHF